MRKPQTSLGGPREPREDAFSRAVGDAMEAYAKAGGKLPAVTGHLLRFAAQCHLFQGRSEEQFLVLAEREFKVEHAAQHARPDGDPS